MDWLTQNIAASEDVQIKSLTNNQTIHVIAGPKARDLLAAVSPQWCIVNVGRQGYRYCNWGHRTRLNIAYALVELAFAEAGTAFVIGILGTMVCAKIIPAGPCSGSR